MALFRRLAIPLGGFRLVLFYAVTAVIAQSRFVLRFHMAQFRRLAVTLRRRCRTSLHAVAGFIPTPHLIQRVGVPQVRRLLIEPHGLFPVSQINGLLRRSDSRLGQLFLMAFLAICDSAFSQTFPECLFLFRGTEHRKGQFHLRVLNQVANLLNQPLPGRMASNRLKILRNPHIANAKNIQLLIADCNFLKAFAFKFQNHLYLFHLYTPCAVRYHNYILL